MGPKGWLVSVALGLLPAMILAFAAQYGIVKAIDLSVPAIALATKQARSSLPTATTHPEATATSKPPYVPVPTDVTALTIKPANKPAYTATSIAIPDALHTATTTASPTPTPTQTNTSTATPTATPTNSATPVATPTHFPTASYTPSPTSSLFDFVIVGREEKCDPNSPRDYKGDLVSGRVLDVDGRPLPAIHVAITSIYTDSPWSAETTTDEAGYFRFFLTKGNFETRVMSGSSEVATELWTRSAAEIGACSWRVTFKKTNLRTPVPHR